MQFLLSSSQILSISCSHLWSSLGSCSTDWSVTIRMYMYVYIYIYIYTHIIQIHAHMCVSLSLYIYIYIYIYSLGQSLLPTWMTLAVSEAFEASKKNNTAYNIRCHYYYYCIIILIYIYIYIYTHMCIYTHVYTYYECIMQCYSPGGGEPGTRRRQTAG